MQENDEVVKDVSSGLDYIRSHSEINNVLLTGGDPFIISTKRLELIIHQLHEIDHVQIIRLGSKVPAFNPYRITRDPSFLEIFQKYSTSTRKIYVMTHFTHPHELTDISIEGINLLQKSGVVTINQTPLIRGVNDNPVVLEKLFNKLSYKIITN